MFIHLEDDDVLQLVAFLLSDVNFAPRKLVDYLVAPEKRDRVLRRQIEDAAAQFFLRSRGHIDVQPEANRGANDGEQGKRNAAPRHAHAVGAEGDQLVIRGEPAKDEENRGQQTPGNRENEGERQHVGDEGKKKLNRHIVIDEEGEEFAKDVADHEDEAQDRDREEHVNDQLAADEAVDQFHGNLSWRRSTPVPVTACQWFIEFSTQLRSSVAQMAPALLGERKTDSSGIGHTLKSLKLAKRTRLLKNS